MPIPCQNCTHRSLAAASQQPRSTRQQHSQQCRNRTDSNQHHGSNIRTSAVPRQQLHQHRSSPRSLAAAPASLNSSCCSRCVRVSLRGRWSARRQQWEFLACVGREAASLVTWSHRSAEKLIARGRSIVGVCASEAQTLPRAPSE